MNGSIFKFLSVLVLVNLGFLSNPSYAQDWSTVTTSDGSAPVARHESNAIVYNGMIYLFGGRRDRPVDRYNPATNVWETIATAPEEMHHIQPVLHNNKIYFIGAFSCCYPLEPTIATIHVFDPTDNTWSIAGTMPADRIRGSAGAVSHNNRIYVLGGNTNGHSGGAVGWFDEYNPATDTWTTLPDAPTPRDHFGAVIINNTLIATGGRQSNASFAFTVASTELFDFNTNQWTSGTDIPTQRAGTTTVVYAGQAFIIGGESVTEAHATVETYNPATDEWRVLADMINPRHAGGAVLIGTDLHVFAGSTTRGGSGESNFHEVIDLALAQTNDINTPPPPPDTDSDGLSDDDELNIFLTDINLADTDNDTISDYNEIYSTGTDPTSADTDGDNIDDPDEISQNLDPNNPDTDSDNLTDGDEVSIYFTAADNHDSDADGIADGSEVNVYQTDPLQADSDNDSLSDGIEINQLGSNPLSKDSDNDGLSDAVEYNEHGTNPSAEDSDADGLTDADELYIHSTNPTSNDSDNDGIPDGEEILVYQSNPNASDSDGDGVSDGQEVASGSSLTNIDDDNDGLVNSRDGLLDSDGDGFPNFADRDSDNDGIPDLVEIGFTDINLNGQLDTQDEWTASGSTAVFTPPVATSIAPDTDGDGVPDYIDLDSDQDGIPDLAEATSDYSTSATTHQNQRDSNRDGLSDDYSSSLAGGPANDDSDSTPNHLDLDSDEDGISDLIETGSPDVDNNGQIDNFVDADSDGLADYGRPALGQALPDADNDSLPDLIDSEFTNSRSFGCTLSATSSVDPLFFALLLLSIAGLARNRKPQRATTEN